MGVFGTAAFAQDTETNIIQSKKLKSKLKTQKVAVQTKSVASSAVEEDKTTDQTSTQQNSSKTNASFAELEQKPVKSHTLSKKKKMAGTKVEK